MNGFAVLAVFAVIMVLVMIASSKVAAKRRRDLAELANRLGLGFAGDDPQNAYTDPSFHLFQCGHSRKVSNVISGTWQGLRLAIFDYRYTVGAGKHAHTHWCSAVLVELPARVPYLSIHRKGLFDKIAHFLGLPDIQVRSAAFNERFHVKSANPEFAQRALDGALAEYLAVSADKDSIEMCNGRLLLEHTPQAAPLQLEGLLQFAKGVHDSIPQDVLAAYGSR